MRQRGDGGNGFTTEKRRPRRRTEKIFQIVDYAADGGCCFGDCLHPREARWD